MMAGTDIIRPNRWRPPDPETGTAAHGATQGDGSKQTNQEATKLQDERCHGAGVGARPATVASFILGRIAVVVRGTDERVRAFGAFPESALKLVAGRPEDCA